MPPAPCSPDSWPASASAASSPDAFAARFTRPLVAFGIAEALVGVTAFATPFVLDALTRLWVSVHDDLPQLAGGHHGDPLRRRVPRPDRADVADGRHAAAGHQVRRRPRGTRRRHDWAALRHQHQPAPSSARWSPASISSPSSASPARSRSPPPPTSRSASIAVIAAYLLPCRLDPPKRSSICGAKADRSARTTNDATAPGALDVLRVGVMSLALEIIWFRMLVIFLRPTAYAFTIMLACVLAGIAIGSAIAAPLLRMRSELDAHPRHHPGADRCRRGAVVQRPDARATGHRRRHAVVRTARAGQLSRAARRRRA